ncbi:hypothetical protein [Engelhardtia mirabilis]|uniref:Uncharacterized protein n=1 Tax=Engelhardtia mirabilis TaxID=2528011 RepID=A0A518BFJ9_9BACT|nr:hypothetical protein Pla133_08070 [Planctomycetes bacterium Pla133]QDV00067.1 hypothetical protein Pla86_08060 [Planctomycetes bacterium Pla86]
MQVTHLTSLAALALVPSLASAQTLYQVGSSGDLTALEPAVATLTNAGEALESVAQLGNVLYLGGTSGQVYRYDPASGAAPAPVFAVAGRATDMAVHQADLLVASHSGGVTRFDVVTGQAIEVLPSSFEIEAILVDGDRLIAGTPFGVYQELELGVSNAFAFAGQCGGPINSMVMHQGDLYLGDTTGNIYLDAASASFTTYAYTVGNDATSMVVDGREFLIGGSNATIEVVIGESGAATGTITPTEAVADLWLEQAGATLGADAANLSLAAGGTVSLRLAANTALAGDAYVLLGSASGTAPGVEVGPLTLPLNPDAYTTLTLTSPTSGPIAGAFGLFGADGLAAASLTLPAATDPVLAGLTFDHAFLTWSSADPGAGFLSVSNPISLTLIP